MKLTTVLKSTLLLLFATLMFSACQPEEVQMQTKTYNYSFNTGQIDATYAYSGNHPNTLSAKLMLEEMADDKTKITVTIMNPVAGETYMVHAHDKASPTTTPNQTPYIETPNASVFAQAISNGEASFTSNMSFEKLTTEYEGFFVIHDPLQLINTQDPTTYVVLGNFARE